VTLRQKRNVEEAAGWELRVHDALVIELGRKEVGEAGARRGLGESWDENSKP
jgi:hypothetical protein